MGVNVLEVYRQNVETGIDRQAAMYSRTKVISGFYICFLISMRNTRNICSKRMVPGAILREVYTLVYVIIQKM